MIKLIQNKLWLFILFASVFWLYSFPRDLYNHKVYSYVIVYFAVTYLVYFRGYFDGKEYYRGNDSKLHIVQDRSWDHQKTLQQLIEEHPFCYLELEYPEKKGLPKPNPSGIIHLLQNQKRYVSIALEIDDHWSYFGDSLITKDMLAKGQYLPMLTKEAVKVAVSKNWDLHF